MCSSDLAVIGAGVAGLSVAYELAARGKSVVVIDAGRIGGGMTSRTTAHLASACDDFYAEVIRKRGLDCARRLYESLLASIDRAEAIAATEHIDCDFNRLDGVWIEASSSGGAVLDRELEACARIGIPASESLEPTRLHEGGARRSIRFPRQGRFHPMKYMRGLAAAIAARGGRLYAGTHADNVESGDGAVTVRTSRGDIRARCAVVATNSPIVASPVHFEQEPCEEELSCLILLYELQVRNRVIFFIIM